MPKRKTPNEKPEEQFRRFVETANTLGIEEFETEIEKKFRSVAEQAKKRPETGTDNRTNRRSTRDQEE